MEENNQNNQNNQNTVNAQDIKKEAQDTVNQVKDSFKNIDMKQETEKAKKYFSRFLKEPIKTIGEIAHDKSNTFFKTAIVLIIVWVVASLFSQVLSIVSSIFSLGFSYFFKSIFSNIFSVVESIIAPILVVAILSGIIYLMNNKSKKSFLTTVNTVLVAYIPRIVAVVISLLTLIPGAYRITTPVSGFLGLLTTVFTFFAIKELNDEKENDSAIKKFMIVEGIYYVIRFVLSFLSISI